MTPEQVKSFKQFAPYKSFSNGDLETYRGIYRGHKENVQFFFGNGRLIRIGVYLYEGKDKEKAIQTFAQLYRQFEREYGKVDMPLNLKIEAKQMNAEVLAIGAAANAFVTGRTEMTPRKQRGEMRVSARFIHYPIVAQGADSVAIFFDPR
ncbi:MAG TPA: hypothetical protein VEP30_07235 [Chthoniobacterales bacterium]|nr:hypothetical protein [Chthoniobacterales bacterium]